VIKGSIHQQPQGTAQWLLQVQLFILHNILLLHYHQDLEMVASKLFKGNGR